MKFTQCFAPIVSVILACVVGGGLLLLPAENAQARTYSVPKLELSHQIPINPNPVYGVPPYSPETAFGTFAWQTFVALNWPAACDGSPLKDKKIGEASKAPRVWEFYKFPEDVFNPNGEPPNPPSVIPPPCPGADASTQQVKYPRFTEFESNQTPEEIKQWESSEYKKDNPNQDWLRILPNSKSADILLEGFKPLVDRQGNYILNEIRMNPVEVAQIVKNKWYDAANFKDFNNKDNLFTLICSDLKPNGTYPERIFDKVPCSDNDSVGTIELKAAWMVLPDSVPDEIHSKYYTTTRTFYVETPESVDREKTKVTVPVALVGLHVVQKTSQQSWIWATFEHINNAPDAQSLPASVDYNLYSSDCQGEHCEANTPYVKEPYLWRNEFPHAVTKTQDGNIEKQISSQITRLVSIPPIAQSLNSTWRKKLAEVPNSVWQNYQLIGVQWLQNPYVPYKTDLREVIPKQLANVTLEPYVQKGDPGNSCIACHSLATLQRIPKDPQKLEDLTRADFSFLLKNAK